MQTHTQFFSFLAAALVFLPMLFLMIRTASGTSSRTKCAWLVVFATSLFFFSARHHQDLYRGLDNMIYANMAKAFRSGVQAIRIDEFFSSIPEKVAPSFYFVTAETTQGSTRSHDKAFVLSDDGFSRPWFMVMFPLVESTLPPGLFMPLLGAIWLTMLFAICFRGNGASGIAVFLILVFATPYPLWFFRDDYAEVAGSMLVAMVLLSHSAKPFKCPMEFAVAAFLAGLSTAFHRSTFLFALPVVLLLFAETGSWRNRLALLTGFGLGVLAFFLETRYVSAPYGDWTRTSTTTTLEEGEAGSLFRTYLNYLLPDSEGYFIRGMWPGLKSLGIFSLPLFLTGCLAIFRDKQSGLARKCLPFLLLWVLCICMGRLGRDGPRVVGVWNFRRLCPCVITYVSLFAKPLSELVAGILARKWVTSRLTASKRDTAVVSAAALLCVLCVARNPVSYFAVEGRGSRKIADELGTELGNLNPDLVVFDSFRPQLPFVFDDRFPVLGFGWKAREDWAGVEEWLADVAKTQRVVVVTTWTPPLAEKGLSFSKIRELGGEYESVTTKSFMDAVISPRRMPSTILLAHCPDTQAPDSEEDHTSFTLPFDGGVLGMRGAWTAAPRGGLWSRSSSGFVGPLPRAGHPVEAVVVTSWFPPEGAPSTREVTFAFPGNQTTFSVGEGLTTNTFEFTSSVTPDSETFGEYQVSVVPLFDPLQYGIRNFPNDLGVVFHEITLTRPLSGD